MNKSCESIEAYYKTECPYCQSVNWICNGNELDLSSVDVDAAKCHYCRKLYWLGEPLFDTVEIEDANIANGKTFRELGLK